MSFWGELRRRNVFKVGAAYLVAAWLLAQVVALIKEPLGLPVWFDTGVIVLLAVGFPVAVLLAWAYEVTPDGIKQTKQVPLVESIRHITGHRLNYLFTGLLAAAFALVVIDLYVLPAADEATEANDDPDQATTQPREAPSAASIAVLPFVNMSADAEQEYFSDGLTEEILNKLANIRTLRVAGRTSSFAFKGKTTDFRSIGEALGVDHVLEGSVRKVGNDLRITAQLIGTADGFHLWSETYTRELDDVFAVQEEIAAAVARELSLEFGLREPGEDYGGTDSFEAYDHYLRGRALWATEPLRALQELEQAIELDPDFGIPWLFLTYVRGGLLRNVTSAEDEQAALELVRQAALGAVERMPDRWESQSALAWYYVPKKDWLAADQAMSRARELAARAGQRIVDGSHANYLSQIGRIKDALAEHQSLQRTDPLNPERSTNIEIGLNVLGRYDEANAEYERNKDLPGRFRLGVLRLPHLMEQGDVDAVNDLLSATNNALGRTSGGHVGRLAQVWESRGDAIVVMRSALDAPGHHSRNEYSTLALVAGYYGDSDLAVDLLRDAFLGGGYAGFFMIWHSALSEARRTAPFKQFMQDLGFVELWRQAGNWGDYCRPIGDSDFECI